MFALKTPISDNRDPKGITGNIGKYWEKLDYWILPDFLDFYIIFGLPRNQDLSKKLIRYIWIHFDWFSFQTEPWRHMAAHFRPKTEIFLEL